MEKITMTLLVLIVVLSIACSSVTTENSAIPDNGSNRASNNAKVKPTENQARENRKPSGSQILWDFRKDDLSNPRNFSKAETNAVVKYLFGETDAKIEIRDRLSGSFTKPNAKETLYYLSGCKDEDTDKFTTDCPHVSWDLEGWIAIYDGTTPILKINQALGFSVDKVTDVNGDGKNEILSFSGYAQSGIQTQSLGLGEISDGKYSGIQGFDGWADNCGFGETLDNDKKKAVALVVTYSPTPDAMPVFNEEYFETKCKNGEVDKSAWKKITQKMFKEFYDSIS